CADSHCRVQGCHRILKYKSDISSTKLSKLFFVHLQDIFSVKQDFPAFKESRRFRIQTHDTLRCNGLSASGLSYNSEDLPFAYFKADITDSLYFPTIGVERVHNIF